MNAAYQCMIVEDEPLAQNVLKKYIADHPFLELAAVCPDAVEAQKVLLSQSIQLIFLDINLPKLSGINFLKSIARPPLVIFTTAYPEFAAEGFEMDAIDYILKPFSYERFLKAVNKVLEKLKMMENGLLPPETSLSFIFLKSDKKVYKVDLDDIVYAEALDDYVRVVTEKNQFLVNDTLKNIHKELPAGQFIRVHKSYIIAKNKIVFFEGNYVKVANRDIPIGASYREEIYARLKDKNL
jgi:DNA-binding LytR/AlgR family response regulator